MILISQQLRCAGHPAFPLDLDGFVVAQGDLAEFGRAAQTMGIQYVGLCCGNCPRYTRALAEGYLEGDLAEFGRAAQTMGIQYVGLCCGNCPRYARALDEGYLESHYHFMMEFASPGSSACVQCW